MLRYLSIGAVIVLAATACDRFLNEPNPSQVLSSTLLQPANAPILVRSTIADFDCAYAEYVLASGLVSDELLNGQLQTLAFDMDRRTMTNQNTGNNTNFVCETSTQEVAFYQPIQIARQDGDTATSLMKGWTDAQVPGRIDLIAQAEAYAGYADVLMGEGMCTDAIEGGPQLSADSVLGIADAHLTDAIANATAAGDNPTMQMALLGRARVRLDRGQPALAKADASQIPAGFEVDATFSDVSQRTQNRLWSQMWQDGFAGVEGPFQHATDPALPPGVGALDPRVLSDSLGLGANGVANIFAALKDASVSTPIAIAKSSEAQLIIAEADVDAHDFASAHAIVNALEAAQTGMTPFPPFPDSATAMSAIIAVRSRELFLEGHRLSDFIRYKLPLNPPAGTPYPYGAGGVYGTQLCFPLPLLETLNNPNFH